MRAELDDPAGLEHGDAIGRANGGEPVGDDEGGAALHQAFEGGLHEPLTLAVEGAGRFVEDEDGGIL